MQDAITEYQGPGDEEKPRHIALTPDSGSYAIKGEGIFAHARPLGRFYWRAWQFVGIVGIDWELNIFLADPGTRGKGYGTAVQQLASDY